MYFLQSMFILSKYSKMLLMLLIINVIDFRYINLKIGKYFRTLWRQSLLQSFTIHIMVLFKHSNNE